jgi:hypothetical protein
MKWRILTTLTALLFAIVLAAFADSSPSFMLHLLEGGCLFALILLLAVNVVGIFTLWKKYTWSSFSPLLLSFVGFFAYDYASEYGTSRSLMFLDKNISQYQQIVGDLTTSNGLNRLGGELLTEGPSYKKYRLPRNAESLAPRCVYVPLSSNGVVTVKFVFWKGFNFSREGYMYRSDGDFAAALEHSGVFWPSQTTPHWCVYSE